MNMERERENVLFYLNSLFKSNSDLSRDMMKLFDKHGMISYYISNVLDTFGVHDTNHNMKKKLGNTPVPDKAFFTNLFGNNLDIIHLILFAAFYRSYMLHVTGHYTTSTNKEILDFLKDTISLLERYNKNHYYSGNTLLKANYTYRAIPLNKGSLRFYIALRSLTSRYNQSDLLNQYFFSDVVEFIQNNIPAVIFYPNRKSHSYINILDVPYKIFELPFNKYPIEIGFLREISFDFEHSSVRDNNTDFFILDNREIITGSITDLPLFLTAYTKYFLVRNYAEKHLKIHSFLSNEAKRIRKHYAIKFTHNNNTYTIKFNIGWDSALSRSIPGFIVPSVEIYKNNECFISNVYDNKPSLRKVGRNWLYIIKKEKSGVYKIPLSSRILKDFDLFSLMIVSYYNISKEIINEFLQVISPYIYTHNNSFERESLR